MSAEAGGTETERGIVTYVREAGRGVDSDFWLVLVVGLLSRSVESSFC